MILGIKGTVPLYGSDGKRRNPMLELLATFSIYSMVFPIAFADICTIIYTNVYFRIYNVPWVSRKDYIRIERHKLHKLNWLQTLACVYCEYSNGVAAWVKDVVNQTETYTCAIKHGGPVKGQEHRIEREFKEMEEYK